MHNIFLNFPVVFFHFPGIFLNVFTKIVQIRYEDWNEGVCVRIFFHSPPNYSQNWRFLIIMGDSEVFCILKNYVAGKCEIKTLASEAYWLFIGFSLAERQAKKAS